jgi:hypothetical protein
VTLLFTEVLPAVLEGVLFALDLDVLAILLSILFFSCIYLLKFKRTILIG